MTRHLSSIEEAALRAMITYAKPLSEQDKAPTVQARQAWLNQVPQFQVHGVCECGSCPSIEIKSVEARHIEVGRQTSRGLSGDGENESNVEQESLILGASITGASLLLFIDEPSGDDAEIRAGEPSYLELVPEGDGTFLEFPNPEQIQF